MMMSYKLFGAALILAGGAFASVILNSRETQKDTQLSALISLLRFIRTQIDCYCVPVGEIFRRCDKKTLSECGCEITPEDFSAFLSSLSPPIDGETRDLLLSFSSRLGAGYKEDEVKNCDYHIDRLSDAYEEFKKRSKAQRRKNTVLCMTAAALAVILLL
ncbi:MAG: hypothetical protein E7640_00315 [Ruminococcaceae bacterium]|nr:hypothetical protein [Oscillospiraceae bacterium]